MRRGFFAFWRIILYPTYLHILCAVVAFICCVPIIFPEICPEPLKASLLHYAGTALLAAPLCSIVFLALAAVIHMFRMNNLRALSQVFKWAAVWGSTWLCYVFLAIAADVKPPVLTTPGMPATTIDTVHSPHEQLNGPASLVIPLSPGEEPIDKVAEAPNMVALENHHEELFKSYIDNSPRWSGQEDDDTFYTKPGHLIMVPPTQAGIPALVHVCFRRLIEGDPLPQGYVVVKPGEAFPAIPEDHTAIPDYALDLGRNHFLLLAWRGSNHQETALRAINAAITATDARMQPLLDEPTPETVQRMLLGRETYPGTTPEFRLSEPLAQDGAYQAELYANPGEPGVILVYIKERKTGKTLRILSMQALYSENKDELFRHDIPGSMPHWVRNTGDVGIANVFPHNTPLFAIKLGPQRQYFEVEFDIWFKPTDVRRNRRLLLRRCYKVQAYEPPATEETATEAR